ncbi:MAG: serine/threonine-protein kinase [Candidatus Eremiobacterota bacterium]
MRNNDEKVILPNNFILRDRFKIIRHLGGREINNLYMTKDLIKKNYWVVKELINTFISSEERQEAIKQFEFEAKLLMELDHPELPKLEDYFEQDGKHYLVMEYIEGDGLETIIEETPGFLDEIQVIDWGRKLCNVLSYLHSQKPNPIIFRDLSPENVMLTDNDEIKLIDFGISKIFDPQTKTIAIAKNINPHFSPLEQYSTRLTDTRSDIYSLGATLYYAITKTLPMDAIDRSIGKLPLKPPKHFNKNISDELNNIIIKAMSLNKEERYQSVEDMKREFDSIYRKLKPHETGYETNVLESSNTGEIKKEIKSHKSVNSSNHIKFLSPKVYLLPVLVLVILFIFLFLNRHNKDYVFICNFDNNGDASKLVFLLKSKGYDGKISCNGNPRIILEEGFRIVSTIEKGKSSGELNRLSTCLKKKGVSFLIYNLKNEGTILVISENFKNKKAAEGKLKKLDIKGLNVETCGFFIGNKPVYSVTISIKNQGERNNILDFLRSKGYNPEKGYYNTE